MTDSEAEAIAKSATDRVMATVDAELIALRGAMHDATLTQRGVVLVRFMAESMRRMTERCHKVIQENMRDTVDSIAAKLGGHRG